MTWRAPRGSRRRSASSWPSSWRRTVSSSPWRRPSRRWPGRASCRCRSRRSGSGSSTACSPAARRTTSRRRCGWSGGSTGVRWPRRSPRSRAATSLCARSSARSRGDRSRSSCLPRQSLFRSSTCLAWRRGVAVRRGCDWRAPRRSAASTSSAGRSCAAACCASPSVSTGCCWPCITSWVTAGRSGCSCASWGSSIQPFPPAGPRRSRRCRSSMPITRPGSARTCAEKVSRASSAFGVRHSAVSSPSSCPRTGRGRRDRASAGRRTLRACRLAPRSSSWESGRERRRS